MRQAGGGPGHETAHQVGGVVQPDVLQTGRRQAGRVSARAHDDHALAVAGCLRQPRLAAGVEPPFQDVALDVQRPRNDTLRGSLALRADVDKQRPATDGLGRLGRPEPVQAPPELPWSWKPVRCPGSQLSSQTS
jgi:hypothetical protein